jgi:proline dehydrogenase
MSNESLPPHRFSGLQEPASPFQSHVAETDQAKNSDKSGATTAPPPLVGLHKLKSRVATGASTLVLPLVQRAARGYVGGETVEDALCVARRLADEKTPCTLGFWDNGDCTAREAADIYLVAIELLAASDLDSYLSVKPPALQFDRELASELTAAAEKSPVRLHVDSHGPEVADLSCEFVETMLRRIAASRLGTTLPGRWSRSLTDADWAVERGLSVRVVKGQWPDLADPERDMRAGFLEVIDRLAGRARHVAVATHDTPLAAEAISRLRAAGTSCEIEQLFGMPLKRTLSVARENGVGVRIYVPYGKGYVPNAIRLLMRNPGLAVRIAKNLIVGSFEK